MKQPKGLIGWVLLVGLMMGNMSLVLADEGRSLLGGKEDKRFYLVLPDSDSQNVEFRQKLIKALTPHVRVTRARGFAARDLFETKDPHGGSLYLMAVVSTPFVSSVPDMSEGGWEGLTKDLNFKIGEGGKVSGPLVPLESLEAESGFTEDSAIYAIYPQPGTCQEDIEGLFQKQLFRDKRLQIGPNRAGAGVEHRLLQGKDSDEKPLYVWGFRVHGIGGDLTQRYSSKIVNGMKDVVGDCAWVSSKFETIEQEPVNESIQFTHRIVQPTPYYKAGPQQAEPPDGEFASGTLVRILKDAGSYVQIQSQGNIVAFVSGSNLEAITKGPESVSNLIQDLGSPDVSVRMSTAQALGGLRSGAETALPKLEELAKNDPDEYVRHVSKEAVDDIQKSLSSGATTAKKQGPGHKPAIHGMAVVGFEKVYLYHLPMFNQEHGVQMVLEVSFDEEAGVLYRQQSRRGVPYGLMTFVPQQTFPLLELGNTRMSLKGDLYEGHFERGGAKLAAGVEVNINQVVYLHELNPQETRPKFPEYILFGTPRETFLAHKITAVPNYDQILNVSHTNPSERAIVDGAIVVSLGERDSAEGALKEGKNGKGQIKGLVSGGSDRSEVPFPFRVLQEYYFEVDELSANGFSP